MAPENTALALVSSQPIDPARFETTIEQMYFQGKSVTPEQKAIFAHAVTRTGLDPIVGQIRPVLRKTKDGYQMAIQTSIDGYRLIASRTGEHAGTDDAVFPASAKEETEEKQWYDTEDGKRASRTVKKTFEHPLSASVTVYRLIGGTPRAFSASARWSEYYPGSGDQGFMWRKMPFLMLGKCAEALALRKAFPADLSGIYTDDEMQQAEPVKAEGKVEPPKMTVVNAMAGLTSCPTKEALVSSYCDLIKRHQWSAEERAELSECYVNRMAYVTGTKLSADKAAFTNAEGVIVATVVKDPDGWAMIGKPKVETPASTLAEAHEKAVAFGEALNDAMPSLEETMAEAEREGMKQNEVMVSADGRTYAPAA